MRRFLATLTAAATLTGLAALPAQAAPASSALEGASTWYAGTVGATDAWTGGYDGSGVGIALVDTGADPVPGLEDRIAARFDVSGAPGITDGYGHGTFLAGLMVGGRGPDGSPLGVAPGAHVVSVKVADANGDTSLDRVLAGLAVVRATQPAYNTRVVVLALGGPDDGIADPLEEALEQLWAEGFVVVVPAGNDGVVLEPGVSPYLLTVGAVDEMGTPATDDDEIASWSAVGSDRDDGAKPDVVAPGRSLVSTRVPGSTADRENPGSRIAGRWFRGTGTSMSAAVTAGAVAILLQARPELVPDEVKGILATTARDVPGGDAGVVDLTAALGARAVDGNPVDPQPREPTQPTEGWTESSWEGRSWIGRSWIGRSWIVDGWEGRSWIGRSWIGRSWIDLEWDGRSWIGRSWIDHEWEGRSWIGRSWIGRSWIGRSWIGRSWIGETWTAGSWLSDDWE
jgi:serine protease AprX